MNASAMTSSPDTRRVKSVCPYCGVGCGIVMEVKGDTVTKISGDKDHPANRGRLCTKGNSAHQALTLPGRMRAAHLRDRASGTRDAIPMDDAITQTATRLRRILDDHGPDAISLYVSGQMSIEAQYLANKLAKGYIRTRHIESNSRLCMASAGSGYKLSLGSDAPPGSYDDFDRTGLFFVIGANMADCHPILFLRMMDRVKAGAGLIVVDPRRTATAEKAHLHLQIRPGTDLALLNGLLHILLRDGQVDEEFIAAHTEAWQALPQFLGSYTPEIVAGITGLPVDEIETAARMIGEAGEWMTLWTMGLNQSTHGTWATNAICNLHLATGTICRPGSGPFSLTGQPNAMGGREMGYMGPGLPGQRSALVPADREYVEEAWGLAPGTIRAEAGDGAVGMFEAMVAGEVRACWIICTNPVASMPARGKVTEALGKAELVIVQDAFLDTETTAHADILLPGALWAEASGVMVNSERNLTLTPRAVPAPGEAMADWQIIARVACAMGFEAGFTYSDASEVFAELSGFANPATGYDISGASHARLARGPLQWPIAADGPARNPIRYRDTQGLRFATPSGRARFFARPHLDPAEMPDADFPLILTTGRVQHQWHTLTKTGGIDTLNRLNPGPFIEINPEDAAALSIQEGGGVSVTSRRGNATLPAVITDRMRPGTCFVPFHWADCFGNGLAINAVTSDATDPISLQPELKFCAVSLAPVPRDASISSDTAGENRIAMLASLLGLQDVPIPVLTTQERSYMQGFLGGLQADSLLERMMDGAPIPVLPPGAPVDPERRLMLDGMLAGIYSRTRPAAPPQTLQDSTLLLWASQTGNAETIADEVGAKLNALGIPARITAMEDCTAEALAAATTIIAVTSTFGDGDPPDNAAALWRILSGPTMPRLDGASFAVLALGDSSYAQFCGFGRALDERLAELGADRLTDRQDCDADYQEMVEDWLAVLTPVLLARAGKGGQTAAEKGVTDRTDTAFVAAPTGEPAYSRNNPAAARIGGNALLSGAGSAKEVRQIVVDLEESGLTYEPGDALGVWPVNAPAEVAAVINAIGAEAGQSVTVKGKGPMPVSEALAEHYDLSRLSQDLLAALRLPELVPFDGTETPQRLGDLLAVAGAAMTTETLLPLLRRMQPRLYSIASSPLLHPHEAHLTMSTVRDAGGYDGLCSTFLADRARTAKVFIQKSASFRLPADPSKPVIMIGPGTGIAPFRAFLQHRAESGARGQNWLFFGEQHADCDYYYRDELADWRAQGVLTRLDTAFSRDQAKKIYVQDRMRQAGSEIWNWLQRGAHVYVCGDATRMARDVDAALLSIVAEYGHMTPDVARATVDDLARQKRYLRDVY